MLHRFWETKTTKAVDQQQQIQSWGTCFLYTILMCYCFVFLFPFERWIVAHCQIKRANERTTTPYLQSSLSPNLSSRTVDESETRATSFDSEQRCDSLSLFLVPFRSELIIRKTRQGTKLLLSTSYWDPSEKLFWTWDLKKKKSSSLQFTLSLE